MSTRLSPHSVRRLALGLGALLFAATPASAEVAPSALPLAYIGPGAGFAAAGGALVLVGTFALALAIVAIWPIKWAVRQLRMRGAPKPKVKRVIVVGLDGFDPELARAFSAQGLMPNFKKLEEQGCFGPLATAFPSISPVAWSSFATGVDASRHNIYDFLTRDPCNYLPALSSTDVRTVPRTLNLGFAQIPMGQKAVTRLLQKSGMCVPDLQGTQGSFSFYSTKGRPEGATTGGQRFQIRVKDGVVESNVKGPSGKDGHAMRCPFRVELDEASKTAQLTVGTETVEIGYRDYSPWMVVPFKGVTGIARFYIQTWEDGDFEIYITPVNINPDSPAMPISHPFVYSIYLAKMLGPYATLGLAEDTWALNERVIDEEAFLKQAWLIFEERKKQLWDVIEKTNKGFVTVVFDTTDRISHMFYRYLDPTHPANRDKDTEKHKHVIRDVYTRMDSFLAEIREKIGEDKDTVLMVMSDHGFCNFRRGVNLNAWLRDEGYLFLKDDSGLSGDWFQNIDWSRTKAFTLGLTGIFINRKGREAHGIVEPGAELDSLTREIAGKLEQLTDPETGESVVLEAYATKDIHSGPYADMAPEVLVGYQRGFRHSWDCATGSVSKDVFSDNTKSWSGDHCVDPRLVPGVLWCNRKINTDKPSILDMAPTVLDLFGVKIPGYMQGFPLFGPDKRPQEDPPPFRREPTGSPEKVFEPQEVNA
jgi:predicted AlkP superfamily phosphohydrolase/phosphomutase